MLSRGACSNAQAFIVDAPGLSEPKVGRRVRGSIGAPERKNRHRPGEARRTRRDPDKGCAGRNISEAQDAAESPAQDAGRRAGHAQKIKTRAAQDVAPARRRTLLRIPRRTRGKVRRSRPDDR